MNVEFGKLISRIQQAASPSERRGKPLKRSVVKAKLIILPADIVEAASMKYSFTCNQLGKLGVLLYHALVSQWNSLLFTLHAYIQSV